MNKITGILVDTIKNEITKVTIDNTIESLHEILNCSCIDIVTRLIGGIPVQIVCDDLGYSKEDPILSIITLFPEQEPEIDVIVGNVFICSFDGIEDICSLSDADIDYILKTQQYVCFDKNVLLSFGGKINGLSSR